MVLTLSTDRSRAGAASIYISVLMPGVLFRQRGSLGDWVETRRRNAIDEVEQLSAAQVLGGSIDDLTTAIVDRHRLTEPVLHTEDRYSPGVEETKVDVRRDPMRAVFDRSRPAMVSAHRVAVHIPFEGDAAILDHQPSSFTLNPPIGAVQGSELVLMVEMPTDVADGQAVARTIDDLTSRVAQYFQWAATDVRGFNSGLPGAVQQALQRRRSRLETGQALEDGLGIPVRRRSDPSPGLAVEVRRRQPIPVSATPASSEAYITDAAYTAIVTFIGQIRGLIERYPRTFSSLQETVLRDILLLILNNTFGSASGETFSRNGKTDIFITTAGGPVFIAECKFWKGRAAMHSAIGQLVGYLAWRDTKAAMVLFVKQEDVTGISAQALQAFREHPLFERDAANIGGDPSVILHREGDAQRHVRIALIVVPVPQT